MMDDGKTVEPAYTYKLTYEPKGSGELITCSGKNSPFKDPDQKLSQQDKG